LEKAQTAGLLHDCAKCIPNEKKLKLQERLRIKISEDNPKNAYVSEFDEPQYKLWYYVDKANK
jgi:HD superfamily phosphodiesterase